MKDWKHRQQWESVLIVPHCIYSLIEMSVRGKWYFEELDEFRSSQSQKKPVELTNRNPDTPSAVPYDSRVPYRKPFIVFEWESEKKKGNGCLGPFESKELSNYCFSDFFKHSCFFSRRLIGNITLVLVLNDSWKTRSIVYLTCFLSKTTVQKTVGTQSSELSNC